MKASDRIVAYLQRNPSRSLTPAQIAYRTGVSLRTTRYVLRDLDCDIDLRPSAYGRRVKHYRLRAREGDEA